jgi:hypothetical protein
MVMRMKNEEREKKNIYPLAAPMVIALDLLLSNVSLVAPVADAIAVHQFLMTW